MHKSYHKKIGIVNVDEKTKFPMISIKNATEAMVNIFYL